MYKRQALLYAMEARAYSNIGEANRCARAARLAEDTFSDCRPGDNDPDWLKFFSDAELNAENAHSYRDLAYNSSRSPQFATMAAPVMERAVDLFRKDPEHVRSYAFNLIGMASVHLLQGEPEQAAVMAEQAVDIATKVRSERLNTRVRKTSAAASRDFKDVAEINRLADRVVQDIPEFAPAG